MRKSSSKIWGGSTQKEKNRGEEVGKEKKNADLEFRFEKKERSGKEKKQRSERNFLEGRLPGTKSINDREILQRVAQASRKDVIHETLTGTETGSRF